MTWVLCHLSPFLSSSEYLRTRLSRILTQKGHSTQTFTSVLEGKINSVKEIKKYLLIKASVKQIKKYTRFLFRQIFTFSNMFS